MSYVIDIVVRTLLHLQSNTSVVQDSTANGTTASPVTELQVLISNFIFDKGSFLAPLIIGIIIGWFMKAYIGDRGKNKVNDKLLADKDLQIRRLSMLVYKELNELEPKKANKGIIDNLIDFFNRKTD